MPVPEQPAPRSNLVRTLKSDIPVKTANQAPKPPEDKKPPVVASLGVGEASNLQHGKRSDHPVRSTRGLSAASRTSTEHSPVAATQPVSTLEPKRSAQAGEQVKLNAPVEKPVNPPVKSAASPPAVVQSKVVEKPTPKTEGAGSEPEKIASVSPSATEKPLSAANQLEEGNRHRGGKPEPNLPSQHTTPPQAKQLLPRSHELPPGVSRAPRVTASGPSEPLGVNGKRPEASRSVQGRTPQSPPEDELINAVMTHDIHKVESLIARNV